MTKSAPMIGQRSSVQFKLFVGYWAMLSLFEMLVDNLVYIYIYCIYILSPDSIYVVPV
jgi:hypothetical protein